MSGGQNTKLVVLLVEDDPGDRELTRRALQGDGLSVNLQMVTDGEEALNYLRRKGAYSDRPAPRPDLIFLDLNMPRIDGRQVLEEIGKSPDLCSIPVVVLTTSLAEEDVSRAYALGCTSYIQKPTEADRFIAVLRQLHHYWSDLVTLPVPTEHPRRRR